MSTVQIFIPELFIQEMEHDEIQRTVKEALVIRGYAKGDLSMGEVAEILGMNYVDAHNWMNSQGIATTKRLPPDLREATCKNRVNFEKRLGIA